MLMSLLLRNPTYDAISRRAELILNSLRIFLCLTYALAFAYLCSVLLVRRTRVRIVCMESSKLSLFSFFDASLPFMIGKKMFFNV